MLCPSARVGVRACVFCGVCVTGDVQERSVGVESGEVFGDAGDIARVLAVERGHGEHRARVAQGQRVHALARRQRLAVQGPAHLDRRAPLHHGTVHAERLARAPRTIAERERQNFWRNCRVRCRKSEKVLRKLTPYLFKNALVYKRSNCSYD